MSHDLLEKLRQAVKDYRDDPAWDEVGTVVEVDAGIIKISGLRGAEAQEVLSVESGASSARALALNLEEDYVGALVLGEYAGIAAGDVVRRTKQVISIPVGEQLKGRVIDPLGNDLDGLGPVFDRKSSPQYNFLENSAPGVLDRSQVNYPLHTGIKAIDAMIPIGRGQRELISGDRQTGKTALALDMIMSQGRQGERPVVCIYVAIGQKESKTASIIETLKTHGALSHTVVVAAPAASSAALWYLAPFAGCAIGEYFRDRGQDALIIYDDLSKHAAAWRQISLLLRRPAGREAYPGDVFYLHSRLLERAGKLTPKKGGGSLTAIPIIETQLGDITAYIPTNVISITDGQIYLDTDLFYQGQRPAVNVGLSVSRVGQLGQTPAMKKIAGKLRLELAQFRELQTFMQFAADVDENTKQRIRQGTAMTELLKQQDLEPVPFPEQVVVLYAGLHGYFNDSIAEDIPRRAAEFLEHVKILHPEILDALVVTRDMNEATEQRIKEAADTFFAAQA